MVGVRVRVKIRSSVRSVIGHGHVFIARFVVSVTVAEYGQRGER